MLSDSLVVVVPSYTHTTTHPLMHAFYSLVIGIFTRVHAHTHTHIHTHSHTLHHSYISPQGITFTSDEPTRPLFATTYDAES